MASEFSSLPQYHHHHRHLFPLLLLLLLPPVLFSSALAHNITTILSQFPDFSLLNSLLSQAQLAGDINLRQAITVLAPPDASLANFSSLPQATLRDLLAVHAILDYYDDGKLRHLAGGSAVAATLFQTTGRAAGQEGFVNITRMGNRVTINSAADAAAAADAVDYVKVVSTQPYNISVLEVSGVIVPPGMKNEVGGGGGGGAGGTAPAPATPPSSRSGGVLPPTQSVASPAPSALSPAPSKDWPRTPPMAGGHVPPATPPSPAAMSGLSPTSVITTDGGGAPAPPEVADGNSAAGRTTAMNGAWIAACCLVLLGGVF
ncbi:Fasciclin-like arabinogalactan protein 14 [Apostasia shenzhenica]|uniref:Fasciclin-like arabinogalactan protein 14 n=1 Tax=Apostasia shenzhenica TaxID=1088818 RepID=A0A2I0BGX2_9ASPA|nr:Fasciclin-like arabinogalactan protein 14 [Apostasia shenzhenica]